jgi:DnaJ family protein A protein 2
MPPSQDLYSVLGVARKADGSEIRKQYLKLSRQYHPDKASLEDKEASEAKFKEISAAYEILSDEKSRSFYDQTGQIPGEAGPPPGAGGGMGVGMPFPFDMNNLFGMFGGGRGGGGRSGGRRSGKAPARKTQLPLTLHDFYYGRTLKVQLERQRFCGECSGEGAKDKVSCGDCQGSGTKVQMIQIGPMIMQNHGPCPSCMGTGKTQGTKCEGCSGTKFKREEKALELTVKPGMKVGDSIRFEGESSHSEDWTEPGDVVVELTEADEDHGWSRPAPDILEHSVTLSIGEALCGTTKILQGHPAHPNGVAVEIRADFNQKTVFVPGLGMPNPSRNGCGPAMIRINVLQTNADKAVMEGNKTLLADLFGVKVVEVSSEIPLKQTTPSPMM